MLMIDSLPAPGITIAGHHTDSNIIVTQQHNTENIERNSLLKFFRESRIIRLSSTHARDNTSESLNKYRLFYFRRVLSRFHYIPDSSTLKRIDKEPISCHR